MDLSSPSGVEYSLLDCKLRYNVKMPLDFYEVCPKEVAHTFRLLEPWDDRWVRISCGRPWCVRCEGLKMARFRLKIHRYLTHWTPSHLWLLTRSVRNSYSIKVGFDSLHETVKRLTEQKKKKSSHLEHDKITHFIGTYEVKHKLDTGFNVHQHYIIGTEHDRLDYKALHSEWNKAAGYQAHLNVEKIDYGIGGAINYISAYISKGIWGGLTPEMAYWNQSQLFGRHRIRTKQKTAVVPVLDPLRCFCCKTEYSSCNQGHVFPE